MLYVTEQSRVQSNIPFFGPGHHPDALCDETLAIRHSNANHNVPDITQMLYVTERIFPSYIVRLFCVPDITQMLYVTERLCPAEISRILGPGHHPDALCDGTIVSDYFNCSYTQGPGHHPDALCDGTIQLHEFQLLHFVPDITQMLYVTEP